MQIWSALTVMAAAFAAGTINAIAGGGTLISFPSLMGIGLTGQQANVTSTLALWPGSIGGFLGHRKDLEGTRAFALRLVPPSLLGGLTGAWLMLVTPQSVFDRLIPWLILGATLLLAANDPVAKLLKRIGGHERTTGWWIGAIAFQFLVAVYGGYFGAGIGILMLVLLGFLGLTDIHAMNGLKNFFGISINAVAAAWFVANGAVLWPIALVMVAGATAGGFAGAHFARRIGKEKARAAVVAIGLFVTAVLLIQKG